MGALWGSVGSSRGDLEANRAIDAQRALPRPLRELSTPMVYNPQCTLESLLLLREFCDFIVLRKTHVLKTLISLGTSVDLGPIRRAGARRKRHLNPSTPPLEKTGCKSRTCMFYLSKIDVFHVPRRSGAFSRIS